MQEKILTLSLVFVFISVALFVYFLPDNRLHIVACDVGQGDAILLSLGSFQAVIDGGPNNDILTCLGKYMPMWDKKVELVFLTHPQADHYTGLIELNRRFTIGQFLTSESDNDTEGYRLLNKELGSRNVSTRYLYTGNIIEAGPLKFAVHNPPRNFNSSELNDYSLAFTLSYLTFDALFTGDLSPVQIDRMLQANSLSTVEYLKVPHHGSRNGLTSQLLDATKPQVAVISAGVKNRFGHPDKEVLELLSKYQVPTRRTDIERSVELVTNGTTWEIVR